MADEATGGTAVEEEPTAETVEDGADEEKPSMYISDDEDTALPPGPEELTPEEIAAGAGDDDEEEPGDGEVESSDEDEPKPDAATSKLIQAEQMKRANLGRDLGNEINDLGERMSSFMDEIKDAIKGTPGAPDAEEVQAEATAIEGEVADVLKELNELDDDEVVQAGSIKAAIKSLLGRESNVQDAVAKAVRAELEGREQVTREVAQAEKGFVESFADNYSEMAEANITGEQFLVEFRKEFAKYVDWGLEGDKLTAAKSMAAEAAEANLLSQAGVSEESPPGTPASKKKPPARSKKPKAGAQITHPDASVPTPPKPRKDGKLPMYVED